MEQNFNIPTVGGAASNIINYARDHDFKYTNGSPIRYISFPFPVAGQPQRVHHKYIFEGNDVVSGKPMMQAFIDALTLPLTLLTLGVGAPFFVLASVFMSTGGVAREIEKMRRQVGYHLAEV